jgi:endonuclease/exonuclease/phosphatase family metal-dependent hydrolase
MKPKIEKKIWAETFGELKPSKEDVQPKEHLFTRQQLVTKFAAYTKLCEEQKKKVPVKSKTNLRIATWNICEGHTALGKKSHQASNSDFLKMLNLDILCLQEVKDPKSFNRGQYPYMLTCETNEGFQNCILSQFPLKLLDNRNFQLTRHEYESRCVTACLVLSSSLSSLSSLSNPLGTITVHSDAQELKKTLKEYYRQSICVLCNIHLDLWDRSARSRESQLNELHEMIRQIEETFETLIEPDETFDLPIIVVGDWNCLPPSSETTLSEERIAWIKQSSRYADFKTAKNFEIMANMYEIESLKPLSSIGVSVWTGVRVDQIMTKNVKSSQVARVFIIPTLLSDHYPLITDFRFFSKDSKSLQVPLQLRKYPLFVNFENIKVNAKEQTIISDVFKTKERTSKLDLEKEIEAIQKQMTPFRERKSRTSTSARDLFQFDKLVRNDASAYLRKLPKTWKQEVLQCYEMFQTHSLQKLLSSIHIHIHPTVLTFLLAHKRTNQDENEDEYYNKTEFTAMDLILLWANGYERFFVKRNQPMTVLLRSYLDFLIQKAPALPASNYILAFRGFKSNTSKAAEFFAILQQDAIVRLRATTSWSTSLEVAQEFAAGGLVLIAIVPPKTNLFFVPMNMFDGMNEDEILLPSWTRLQILDPSLSPSFHIYNQPPEDDSVRRVVCLVLQ